MGNASHAEGLNTTAIGAHSHSEGNETTARGIQSHAEGRSTIAAQQASHAEGFGTMANATYSHAEGDRTLTARSYAHTEGSLTTAKGTYSHAEGIGTITHVNVEGQHAEGRWNQEDATAVWVVGGGISNTNRLNIITAQASGSGLAPTIVMPVLSGSLDFADDTAAATGGIPLGGLYRTGNAVQIRLV